MDMVVMKSGLKLVNQNYNIRTPKVNERIELELRKIELLKQMVPAVLNDIVK
jgi:hypothetical protein